MRFIGRQSELETLEREYQRDGGFVVVYGRRRVGKTTLIKEFISFIVFKENSAISIQTGNKPVFVYPADIKVLHSDAFFAFVKFATLASLPLPFGSCCPITGNLMTIVNI